MYKRILIVVDPRPAGRAAIEQGTELARTNGAEVVYFSPLPKYAVLIADAPPYIAVPADDYHDEAKADADAALADATALAASLGVRSISIAGDGEDDARSIIEAARERDCDVIVVASEGRNAIVRLLTGSIIPGLITASPVPVLVCRNCAGASAGGRAPDLPIGARVGSGGAAAGTHVQ